MLHPVEAKASACLLCYLNVRSAKSLVFSDTFFMIVMTRYSTSEFSFDPCRKLTSLSNMVAHFIVHGTKQSCSERFLGVLGSSKEAKKLQDNFLSKNRGCQGTGEKEKEVVDGWKRSFATQRVLRCGPWGRRRCHRSGVA